WCSPSRWRSRASCGPACRSSAASRSLPARATDPAGASAGVDRVLRRPGPFRPLRGLVAGPGGVRGPAGGIRLGSLLLEIPDPIPELTRTGLRLGVRPAPFGVRGVGDRLLDSADPALEWPHLGARDLSDVLPPRLEFPEA